MSDSSPSRGETEVPFSGSATHLDPDQQDGGGSASPTVAGTSNEVVYRLDDQDPGVALERGGLDVPATLGGALAALGAFLLLSSLVGAVVGTIGYQSGVEDSDLSIGGLIAGLVVLFVACLIGGWVAGRLARHRGGLHGLLAVLWVVVLAAVLAALAALVGDTFDVTDQIDLPSWFSGDALAVSAIVTGVVALLLMLLGGWLGGRLGERRARHESVSLVETRRAVREHPGGIASEGSH